MKENIAIGANMNVFHCDWKAELFSIQVKKKVKSLKAHFYNPVKSWEEYKLKLCIQTVSYSEAKQYLHSCEVLDHSISNRGIQFST